MAVAEKYLDGKIFAQLPAKIKRIGRLRAYCQPSTSSEKEQQ
jgi:hypothetical protein